jgi:hypothetical protein
MSALASWAALDPAERRARCRALAALARVFAGPYCPGLNQLLRAAEDDAAALADCDRAMALLPTIPVRKMWAVMAALERVDPGYPPPLPVPDRSPA